MSSSHRYHSASGPKVSPKCIQIHNNARRILIQCFDHRSYICRPVASPLRLSKDRCCWRCSLWPMGYKVCSRLLVLFSYSVEVLGGLCLFVYFDYSARILSHDSFTKRVLSRQFFLLSLLDRLEDVCFVPLECRWRQSKGTSTAYILN